LIESVVTHVKCVFVCGTVRPITVSIVNYEVVHYDTLRFQWRLENVSVPLQSTAWYRNR